MKWFLSQASEDLHHWLLQEGEQTRSAIFNLQRHSLRLMGKIRRLFFLQVQGFLQKKILLRSEYGIVIGETGFSEKASTGQLTFNGQTFFYQVENEQLVLLDKQKKPAGSTQLTAAATLSRYEFYSLLFSFAWFVTADAVPEKEQLLSIA